MRKLKNIIMILLITVLLVTTYFTMKHIEGNTEERNEINEKSITENIENENMSEDFPEETVPTVELSEEELMKEFLSEVETNIDTLESNNSLDKKYIVLFGIESLFISLLISYLGISGFNKKSFKETFGNLHSIIAFVLITLVLSSGITITDWKIADKYFNAKQTIIVYNK